MYCRRCGAPLHEGVVVCPECGARQSQRLRAVRCASCRHRVPLGRTVCPYCARTVRPAGPRWSLVLGAVVVIVLAALWGLGKLPVERAAQEVAAVQERLSGLVQILGPAEVPTAAPVSTPQQVAQAATELPLPTTVATPTPQIDESTPLPEPSPTVLFSPTPAATEPPAPTATPAPTEAPPTATSTPLPTATPVPNPSGRITYRVQSGDTLSTIAAQFNISWEALAAANGLNSRSVLRIGQELIIPVAGSALPATAQPTATQRPAAAPTATQPPPAPALNLAAPVQLSPADQTPISGGSASIELVWEPVPSVPSDGQYEVQIRWLEGGAPQELNPPIRTAQNSTRVPLWLFGKADQYPTRRYTWTVRVVQITTDGQGGERVIPLSPASPARIFYWN